jgi:hypothetical protein
LAKKRQTRRIFLPISLHKKLEKIAQRKGMTITEYVQYLWDGGYFQQSLEQLRSRA